MKRIGLVAMMALVLVVPSLEARDSSKTRKVRQLLTLMKAADMGVQVLDNMIGSMKASMPNVPDQFWRNFRKDVKSSELLDMMIPIYERNLEEADIDELVKFYSSPAGQRFVAKQPVILQEAMHVGQLWGEQIAQKVMNDLKAKGLTAK